MSVNALSQVADQEHPRRITEAITNRKEKETEANIQIQRARTDARVTIHRYRRNTCTNLL